MPLLYATTTAGLPGLFWPRLSGNFRGGGFYRPALLLHAVSAAAATSAGPSSCPRETRSFPVRHRNRVSGFLEAVQSIRFMASAAV